MNNFITFLKKFIMFAFSYSSASSKRKSKLRRSVEVDSVEIGEVKSKRTDHRVQTSDRQVKLRLIVYINWLLMGICTLSFFSMLIFIFTYPDKAIPDLIQNAFFTTLGWFGGVLATFFKVDQGD